MKTIIIYVTKYALTRGILCLKVDPPDPELPGFITRRGAYQESFHGEGRDWHRTLAGATTKAEEMRKTALASLAKRIEKIKKLDLTKASDA